MKTTLLLSTLLSLCTLNINAQTIMFRKNFSVSPKYAIQTSDSGYVVAGTESGICLIKTDGSGDTIWTKRISGAIMPSGMIQQTTDGGIIISGYTTNPDGNPNICLAKTDLNGNLLWMEALDDGGTYDLGYSVQQTTDEGFIIANFGHNLNIIKTDVNGTLMWSKSYGNSASICGLVKQTHDGGYIVVDITYGYLVKTDSIGNSIWAKKYGASQRVLFVQETKDGGLIMTGINSTTGVDDVCLIKTDSAGNVIWSKTYGGTGSDYSYLVQQTSDGGYIMAGETSSFGFNMNTYLIKTDDEGNLLWSKVYDVNDAFSIQQTFDRGYIIAGGASPNYYLIKTDSLGNSGCNDSNPPALQSTTTTLVTNIARLDSSVNTIVTPITGNISSGVSVTTICSNVNVPEIHSFENSISIYPNPTTDRITIENSVATNHFELYDITGKLLERKNISVAKFEIDLSSYRSGIYFLTLGEKENQIHKKIVKE